MADEQVAPAAEPTPSDPSTNPEETPAPDTTAPTADTPAEDDDSAEAPTTVCADGNDEDPELFVGEALKDPWDDAFQSDWPQNEVTSA